jgi:hypothetical protein
MDKKHDRHQTITCHACNKWCDQHPYYLRWMWCYECQDHIIHDLMSAHRVAHRVEKAAGTSMAPGEYQEAFGK